MIALDCQIGVFHVLDGKVCVVTRYEVETPDERCELCSIPRADVTAEAPWCAGPFTPPRTPHRWVPGGPYKLVLYLEPRSPEAPEGPCP